MAPEPKTLQEAVIYFADPENCRVYLVARRWPAGVICPTCGSQKVSYLANQRKWQCASHHAKRQFSAKTGTIFEDSPLGLDKWLVAMWLVCNCKNGISSYEIHRALGISQKSAWHMDHRIRMAMHGTTEKLSGEVEVDETFIGGRARNMHADKKRRVFEGKRGGRRQGGCSRLAPASRQSPYPRCRRSAPQGPGRRRQEPGLRRKFSWQFRLQDNPRTETGTSTT